MTCTSRATQVVFVPRIERASESQRRDLSERPIPKHEKTSGNPRVFACDCAVSLRIHRQQTPAAFVCARALISAALPCARRSTTSKKFPARHFPSRAATRARCHFALHAHRAHCLLSSRAAKESLPRIVEVVVVQSLKTRRQLCCGERFSSSIRLKGWFGRPGSKAPGINGTVLPHSVKKLPLGAAIRLRNNTYPVISRPVSRDRLV